MGSQSEVLLYTGYVLTTLSDDFEKQRLKFHVCACSYIYFFLYFFFIKIFKHKER